MDNAGLVKALSNLVQLDIDTVHAYDQAVGQIDDPIIRDRLLEFQSIHQSRIGALAGEIESLGGQPPDRGKDVKGYVMEAFTAIRSFSGLKGALAAMKTTEEITNKYYGEAVSWEVPSDLKALLRTYFSEEKIHLEYINGNLQAIS
jgi:competence protein ComEA